MLSWLQNVLYCKLCFKCWLCRSAPHCFIRCFGQWSIACSVSVHPDTWWLCCQIWCQASGHVIKKTWNRLEATGSQCCVASTWQQITHLHWKAFKQHTFCVYFATYLILFSGLNQSVNVLTHNDVCCLCVNDQRQGWTQKLLHSAGGGRGKKTATRGHSWTSQT